MRILLHLLFMFCFQAALYAQNNTMTLQQCIATATSNNIAVKQAGLKMDAAKINLQQAKSNLLPSFNGNLGYGFNQGRNVDPLTNNYINQQLASSGVGLNANMILFDGMQTQNVIKRNRYNYQATILEEQQEKDNLVLSVIIAYLQVLSSEEVLVINQAQMEVTKQQVARTAILVQEGSAADYQLAELRGQLGDEQLALINANNTLQQAKLALFTLMNQDYQPNVQLDKADLDKPLMKYASSADEVYQVASQYFKLLKANEMRENSASLGLRIAKSGFYPIVRLTGNLGSSYSSLAETLTPTTITEIQTNTYVRINGSESPVLAQQQKFDFAKTNYFKQLNNNLGTYVGVNIQIPIFNNFQTRNQLELAKITISSTQLDSENDKRQLRQAIEQAYLDMSASFERCQVLSQQVKDFEESFRAATTRFESGVIHAAAYLVAKNNFDRTNINFIRAKYEYVFRTRILEFYSGRGF